jgi:hypothetical protein
MVQGASVAHFAVDSDGMPWQLRSMQTDTTSRACKRGNVSTACTAPTSAIFAWCNIRANDVEDFIPMVRLHSMEQSVRVSKCQLKCKLITAQCFSRHIV